MLITDLCLFGSPIGVIELITHTYYKAYTGTSYLIHTQNLHLWQTYSYSDLPYDSYLYLSPVEHILILISCRTHTYIDFLVCGTELIHILIRRYLSTYSYLYLSQISRRSSQNLCVYRDTLRYYKAILILRSLHLFEGTRRYYRDITEHRLVLRNLFL